MSFFSRKSKNRPSHGAKIPPVGAYGHYNKKQGVKALQENKKSLLTERETQISLHDVTLSFEGRKVISALSFDVREGDYLCIVGENGSGKTTLINAVSGLIKPTEGRIELHGITRDMIGVLPQFTLSEADFPATVSEVVLSGCLTKSHKSPFLPKGAKQLSFSAMEKLGITALKDRSFRELSGGQRQRVLIARAICAADKMLILDEPTTGLDRAATADVYSLIEEMNKSGMTVICVTHDMRSALRYATKILHINKDSFLIADVEEYKKLPEAQIYLQGEDGGTDRDLPYGEGGFRYKGGENDD